MSADLGVLIVTNLFPSNVDPSYAPFNRQQFAALGRLARVEVLGVVPWRFGRYFASGSSADVVAEETIDGLKVYHPRYPPLPGLPSLNATLLAASLAPRIARRRRRFDVLLASYAYPDGCAGVMLGQKFGMPVVVKCHGSDLNRVPSDRAARAQLERFLPRAASVVVVSQKLKERARELGVAEEKIRVVYNGIDRHLFRLIDRAEARRELRLPLDRRIVLYVGHLAEHKGTIDLLQSLDLLVARVPDALTVFIGEGPLADALADQAELGRALAIGRVTHEEVPVWMAAADVLCLPSWDEGMPNVVREAHACGRPVVATAVGGVPEAIHSHELGRLVPPRRPDLLAMALADMLNGPAILPQTVASTATVPSWEDSARALHDVLAAAAATGKR